MDDNNKYYEELTQAIYLRIETIEAAINSIEEELNKISDDNKGYKEGNKSIIKAFGLQVIDLRRISESLKDGFFGLLFLNIILAVIIIIVLAHVFTMWKITQNELWCTMWLLM